MEQSAGPLLEVLSLAVAVAASPFAIIPAILLLFTARPRASAGAFLGGWALGLLCVTLAASALASVIQRAEDTPTWASWARIVLGVALLVLGVRKWLQRSTKQEAPGWLSAIESAGPGRAFGLALLMAVANPKILLLAAAAGVAIGAADVSTTQGVTASILFTAIASITVALPIGLYLVLGSRVLDPLTRARDWLVRNNAVVMAVVIFTIGLVVLAEGVSGL